MTQKILIIKPSSLGDIIHSLPFLKIIKEKFSTAKIHWVVAREFKELLEDHPMIDKLWVIDKKDWKKLSKIKNTILEIKNLIRDLRAECFDIVVDLQGLFRSALIAKGSKSPIRLGFKDGREFCNLFYTHLVEGGRDFHAVDRYLKIANMLGCSIDKVEFSMPLIKEGEQIKSIKERLNKYAVIIPDTRWQSKRWPPENFGKLASMLDIKCFVIGSKSSVKIANKVVANSKENALSIAGQTDLKDLISVIKDARFVVTNDSGPMHIAAVYNIPIVAIFGPTNPVRTGPYSKKNIIVKSNVSCSPCYKKRCKKMICMDKIYIKEVLEAIKTI